MLFRSTSMGGESEEIYDDSAELYYYNSSMTVQIQSDWEMHIPIPYTISKASAYTKSDGTTSIQALSQASLFFNTTPTIPGRNANYERIG